MTKTQYFGFVGIILLVYGLLFAADWMAHQRKMDELRLKKECHCGAECCPRKEKP